MGPVTRKKKKITQRNIYRNSRDDRIHKDV